MKNKIVISFGSLGLALSSVGHELAMEDKKSWIDEASNIHEKSAINSAIMETIKEIDAHGAFIVDERAGVIYIDPLKLPEYMRDRLLQAKEVTEVLESDLVKLDEKFSFILAKNNAFKKVGTPEGHFINQVIVENLKQNATPILREEMAEYLSANFNETTRI